MATAAVVRHEACTLPGACAGDGNGGCRPAMKPAPCRALAQAMATAAVVRHEACTLPGACAGDGNGG
ncbi:MAG: hypothetical protein E7034_09205, partial [Akkermansiaceae bacterium]|nr:hypothetical protein [Akkermansiaceae bacterium]